MSDNKLYRLFLIIAVLIFILTVYILNLQMLSRERYAELAEKNRVKKVTVTSPRGNIISSDNKVIAGSKPYYSLYADIDEISSDANELSYISEISGIPADSIMKLAIAAKKLAEDEILLKSNLDIAAVTYIEENSNLLRGLIVKDEQTRFYPYSTVYSHSVGYIGNMTKQDAEKLRKEGYSLNDLIGKTGLENYYEKFLKGRNGVKYYEVDASGRLIKELEKARSISRRPGYDLYITLDHSLTMFVDSIMNEFECGAVIISDSAGRVLTLYSKPSFDPNIFVYGIKREQWEFLSRNVLSPFLNRCTSGLYPPGSVFKMITALAAMKEGYADSSTYLQQCTGNIIISGTLFNCWKEHGELDLYDALIQSCDVYFYQLGIKLGINAFEEYSLNCGFSSETGIDVYEENSGLVPNVKYFNKKYGKDGWGMGMMANLSIGQGDLLVTPIQINMLTLALALEGKMLKPILVDSILDTEHERIYVKHKEQTGILPFLISDIRIIREAMKDVVNTDKGTGRNGMPKKGIVAGKTATAENPHGIPHAWFTCFYPYEKPEICVTVVIENGGSGSSSAAVIARKIIEKYQELEFD